MKVLAISGLHNDNLNSMFSHIKTSNKETNINFNQKVAKFHRQVYESFEMDFDGFSKPQTLQLGEMRVQQAAQILLEYSESPVLYWNNPLTVSMLGFWKKMEPQTKFLLLYQPPWIAINYLYRQFPEKFEENPEMAVIMWKTYNKRLLQFYNNNKENCVLFNSSFLAESFGQLNVLMKEKFGIELLVNSGEQISKNNTQPDSSFIYLLIQNDPELLDLYMQIEAQADLLEREPDITWQEELQKLPVKKEILASWYKNSVLVNREKNLNFNLSATKSLLQQKTESSERLREQLDLLEKENQDLGMEVDNGTKKIESISDELQSYKHNSKQLENELFHVNEENKTLNVNLDQLKSNTELSEKNLADQKQINEQLNNSLKSAKNEVKELKQSIEMRQQEEELSLLQLHQVQEELESYFLKNKEHESEVNSLKKRIGDYQNTTDELNQHLKKSQENNSYLEVDLNNIKQKLNDEIVAHKKLQGIIIQKEDQIKQRESELKQSRSRLKELENKQVKISKEQVEQLTKQNKQLADDKNKQTKLANKLQQQISKLNEQLKTLNAELEKNKQEIENYQQEEELTLLQLHQVQEELEYYFLLQQDTQKLLDGYAVKMHRAQKLIVGYARQSTEKH